MPATRPSRCCGRSSAPAMSGNGPRCSSPHSGSSQLRRRGVLRPTGSCIASPAASRPMRPPPAWEATTRSASICGRACLRRAIRRPPAWRSGSNRWPRPRPGARLPHQSTRTPSRHAARLRPASWRRCCRCSCTLDSPTRFKPTASASKPSRSRTISTITATRSRCSDLAGSRAASTSIDTVSCTFHGPVRAAPPDRCRGAMCMRSGSGRGSDLAAGRSGTHSQRAFLGGARPGRSGAAGTEETGGGAPRLARGAAGVGRIGSAPQRICGRRASRERARAALKRLFPQGPPGASFGIDYYLLLASMPDGLTAAYAGIRRLAHSHPDDPRYQLALAQLMLRQRHTALAGLTLLQQLLLRDDVRTEDADRLLASGLLRLGAERAPPRVINAYLARHPEDAEVRVLREEQERAREERGLLSPETFSGLLPGLQQRLAKDLASGPGGVQARSQARLWLDRSRGSRNDHHDMRAAAELRAALAFYRQDYESEIGVAENLESQGFGAEAGELLASAARLAPQSTWLFETRVRWLVAHGESASAIELLRARGLGRKWTARARDKLLASALEQRASEEAKAGRVEAAISDLEDAIHLAPRDAWMRYRLAEYYRGGGE